MQSINASINASIKVARITTLMVKEKGVDNKTLNKYAY
jgi:hypothetical protein